MNDNKGFGRFTDKHYAFCMPMSWFTLQYGMAPLRNKLDVCRLECQNIIGAMVLSAKQCAASINHGHMRGR